MSAPTMAHRLAAEFVGTFLLVFGGCGAAVFAADPAEDKSVGIGFLGVSVAFGLTVLTMAYAVGPISGGHFNPAVTLVDRLLGSCYSVVEQCFRPAMRIGFASRFPA